MRIASLEAKTQGRRQLIEFPQGTLLKARRAAPQATKWRSFRPKAAHQVPKGRSFSPERTCLYSFYNGEDIMISEPFVVEKSRINQVNPTARIVFATAYSFIIALSYRFPALFTACFLSVLMVCLSGLNLFAVAKRLAVVNGLILLIWLILPFTYSGEPVFNIGPFAITGQGIILSAQITLKSNAILLAVIALISSMSLVTLGHALSRLRIPEKIVFLFLMTVRYIFVIESEYLRLVRAMKIRGFRPGTNLHTYKTYAYLIGMIFVRASVRAQHVHQAMMCRGFKGNFYSLYKFSSTRLSWIFSTVMTASLIGLLFLEIV